MDDNNQRYSAADTCATAALPISIYPAHSGALMQSDSQLYTCICVYTKRQKSRASILNVAARTFHGITDQMPRRVWIAIGPKDWKHQIDYPPLRIVRFAERRRSGGATAEARR